MATRRAYSDLSDAYSEDFISDEEREAVTPYKAARSRERDRIRPRGGHPVRNRGRGRGRGGRGGSSRNSEPINARHSYDNVAKRVMSASRNRVNELRNQVEELKLHTKDLEQENKLYKKMQVRQEKALRGFEDKENDLPRILDKHSSEVRSLKEQNRRLKEKHDKADRYLRDAEDDLEKVKRKMNKYKEICEQKELQERDELSRKLTKAEIDMEEKDVKIKELERHIEVLKKNHRHELGIEIARQKELKRQLDELNNKQNKVETQLREKEKALEYNNIYSNRIAMTESNSDISPSRRLKKRAPSLSDLTPRDKAKFYEEKRRDEVKKQKELKADQERKKKEKWEAATQFKEQQQQSNSPSPQPGMDFNFRSIDIGLEEKEEKARQKEEKYRQMREETERREMEEIQRGKRELERRQEEDRKRQEDDKNQKYKMEMERENNTRREREERERKDMERREREERIKKEMEERERKEQEERQRREKEKAEQDRRLQLERERLDNDPSLLEERRKKDELLRKLQDMDKIGNNKPIPDPFVAAPRSKENSSGYSTPGKRSDPKEYSFTKPVNNLHQGKPSHEDGTLRQRRLPSKDDDDGVGYNPSFGPPRGGGKAPSSKPLSLFDDEAAPLFSTTKTIDNKPTNLLENLFGPQATTGQKAPEQNKAKNDTFFITNKSPPPNTKKTTNASSSSSFPWDVSSSNVKNTNSHSAFHSDHKAGSTLFGGGAALVEDDISLNNNRVLPRRSRQQNVNAFSVKPSVTAVDTFDDEIEEVVL